MYDRDMKQDILGVKVDDVSMEEGLKIVSSWLEKERLVTALSLRGVKTTKPASPELRSDAKGFGRRRQRGEQSSQKKIATVRRNVGPRNDVGRKYYIVTPNPEFVMQAQRDPEFKEILNKADLSIPDGSGLKLSGKIHHTVTGVDFMDKLCALAEKRGYSIGLLGGRDGVAKMAAARLKEKYPGLKVVFAEEGGVVGQTDVILSETKDLDSSSDGHRTQNDSVDIIFVAFGHGKQERWIVKNMNSFPAKVFMGVGGSFDYISGAVPRAPKLMRNLGLEWLFRLIIQPWRIRRQIDLIRFAGKLLEFKVTN